MQNITAQELLLWSTPIDLVEKYELYNNGTDLSLSNELVYNCTEPWFGLKCQYSFEFINDLSIVTIVKNIFNMKKSYAESSTFSNELIQVPCYIHIKCDRGDINLCLDWREICDGHIDCIDEGLDESSCFEMEIHECEENEYRCHNGLCIPEEFWENGFGDADCLDRSDEFADSSYVKNCFRDPTFRCEEHSCRTNWHDFSCGDGQCVQKYDKCNNGRHHLLINSISNQGNLSDKCWMAMMCLTQLIEDIRGESCSRLSMSNVIYEYVQDCELLFQFPTVPVHFGHIRLLYENISSKRNSSLLIIPDYICYDALLCDCVKPTYFYKNLTCFNSDRLDLISPISGHIWIDIILAMGLYFRSCIQSWTFLNDINKYENVSSLYQCYNSSKLISKHRFTDVNADCCMEDDEYYNVSCSINDKHRIKCFGSLQCLSSLHTHEDCPYNENQIDKKISFQSMCDGIVEMRFTDSNGKIYTDESECHYWPCNNMYSRCDGFWTCTNGKDEENCSPTMCPPETFPCISPYNYSLICLSSQQVNDRKDDCLGAMDELRTCRRAYPFGNNPRRFRCRNTSVCLPSSEICNNVRTCPLGDDEDFCHNRQYVCQQTPNINRTVTDDILCHVIDNEKNRVTYFSVHTSYIYPQLESSMGDEIILWKSESVHEKLDSHDSRIVPSSLLWYCNRGLPVRLQSNNETNQYVCMCPPSYYGHLCQYQNERISLTLGLIQAERRDVYVVIIMLIDANQNIDSHDRFEYIASQGCGIKLNRYLLYSTRPKNISRNYSIRIDVYEKYSIAYHGSWHLTIPFAFLPVNRVSAILYMPHERAPVSLHCSFKCQHGECVKYLNKEHVFCRCFHGWSGNHCNIKLDCQNCSSDSICIGSVNYQSICICPLMKFGRRCILTSFCPENACENNGQCIPADMTLSNSQYTCVCSDEYYGTNCQYRKGQLDIYLEDLDIPPFLLAFLLTVSNRSEPRLTVMLQKLTLFQRLVTFRVTIPYHVVFVESNKKYYLAVVQSNSNLQISTSINPSRECYSIDILFNSTLLPMSPIQRIKHYHIPCQTNKNLHCFTDNAYFCLCTRERHANCVQLNHKNSLQCPLRYHCKNGAQCLQDHPMCPSAVICVCTDCFFGNQCQFYAKGFGITLDEILGYEIRHNCSLSKQPFSIKLSASITMIMFVIGTANGILAALTFRRKTPQEVGCGKYLFVSSITSIGVVTLFSLKFWFLIYAYRHGRGQRAMLLSNCMIIEPCLKLLLYVDNWLNACVACERAFSVFKGVNFDKKKSNVLAKWVILTVILVNMILMVPQMLNLHLFDDVKEHRTWCVVLYSSMLNTYSSCTMFIHFIAPFLINFLSSIFIIIGTARQRFRMKSEHRFAIHFKMKLQQHKHLLISPIIIVILSLPRLIISITLDCNKSSKHFWLYLAGYFISFTPSICICMIFVLPSAIYKREFRQVLSDLQHSLLPIRINYFLNKRS